MRINRLCSKKSYLLSWSILTALLVFYNEFLAYTLNKSRWLEPKCVNRQDCTKILLVADPQIIGIYQRDPPQPRFLVPFTIFDSDMYLIKTYWRAFNFVKPDLVVFLGDLTDEGSSADDGEFYGYVRRLFNIFLEKGTSQVRHIWLPGDNDIGGEDFEKVSVPKLKRFERAFQQPDLISYKNITFFKINRLIKTIPVFKDTREFYDTSKIFIGLSHMPLIFMPSLFVEKVLSKMLPQVLFSGHEHKSMIVSTDALLRQDRQIVPVTPDNNAVFEYTLGATDMYEFIVPTCSYRMGTDKIGFGYAVLERNEIRYTVLWSPSRFPQLRSYLLLVSCFVFCTCVIFISFCCRRAIPWGLRRKYLMKVQTILGV